MSSKPISGSTSGSTTTIAPATAKPPVLGTDAGRVSASRGRATPKGPGFGAVVAGARPILKGAEAVASVLPGGPLVAAALKAPQAMSGPGAGYGGGYGGGYGYKPGGTTMAPRIPVAGVGAPFPGAPIGATPTVSGMGVPGATGGVPGSPGGEGIEGVLADSQAFNMYYLQLQEEISAENRQYSALSNVLKARHDTVKNAIGNIR